MFKSFAETIWTPPPTLTSHQRQLQHNRQLRRQCQRQRQHQHTNTSNTVLKAAEIVSKQSITDYDEALRIFKDNLHDKIEFITFHQNYSYEDFIQGLRPDTENNDQLTFERKDGIFLKIATEALFEYYKSSKKQKKTLDNKDIDLSETFLDFVDFLKNQENKSFRTSTGSTIFTSGFTKNDNIEFKHNNSNRTYLVSGNRLIKLYQQFPEINDIKNVHNDIRCYRWM